MFGHLFGIVDAIGEGRRVEMQWLTGDLVGKLANRRQVVENPKGAPVSGEDQVVIFDDQVMNWHAGQIELQRSPVCTIVKRNEDSGFGSGVEQALLFGIFSHGANEGVVRNSLRTPAPTLTVIGRLIDVRTHIIVLVPVDGYVRSAGVKRRSINLADAAPFGKIFRGDIGPGLAAVPRQLDQAIVGACPDQALGNG